jgi:hypothetical protein
MMSMTSQDSTQRGGDMFGQEQQDRLVRDHIAELRAQAAEERVARSLHAQPDDAPPGYRRPGVRGALGRALIALGSAIAATSIEEPQASRETARPA